MRPDLLALASSMTAGDERFALVTVVRREAPSSARVGDTALVTASGEYHGWAGGGCTRSTVLREALCAIADGEPRLLCLSPEPGPAPRPGLVSLPMTCDSGGTVEIYVEPVLPVPRLLLFGSSPTVAVLSRIGHAMGYRVHVVDPDADKAHFPDAAVRAELAPDALPRGAYVVVATMGDRDLEIIDAALSREPAYVGVVASRKRFEPLRDALAAQGVSQEALRQVAAPAGLDIGARTPEEIALSIMAQIVERRRAAAPKSVRQVSPPEPREAIDPICGMAVTIAGARHTVDADGRTFYFCCAGCRTKFLSDPGRYAAADTAKARRGSI
jgi:xanthine dehydrogenase accessory factor